MTATGNIPQSEVMLGQRFGRGEVVRLGIRSGKRQLRSAELLCDCGTRYVAYLGHLRSGAVKSCGCWRSEVGRDTRWASAHGLSQHPLYQTWRDMLRRCEDSRNRHYRDYGGRGIRVCDRWHDVATFISDIERWLGPRPAGMTLDRIMNDHDYRLDNVQWASKLQQRHNQRDRKPSTRVAKTAAERQRAYRARKAATP